MMLSGVREAMFPPHRQGPDAVFGMRPPPGRPGAAAPASHFARGRPSPSLMIREAVASGWNASAGGALSGNYRRIHRRRRMSGRFRTPSGPPRGLIRPHRGRWCGLRLGASRLPAPAEEPSGRARPKPRGRGGARGCGASAARRLARFVGQRRSTVNWTARGAVGVGGRRPAVKEKSGGGGLGPATSGIRKGPPAFSAPRSCLYQLKSPGQGDICAVFATRSCLREEPGPTGLIRALTCLSTGRPGRLRPSPAGVARQ